MQVPRRKLAFSSCLLTLLSCALAACDTGLPRVDLGAGGTAAPPRGASDPRSPLRIAVGAMISPEATRRYYDELLTVIADGVGRRPVFLQRKTYGELNALVAREEVDLAFVCSGPYTKGHEEFGMELLAVPVSHGKKTYQSYIIVPRLSGVQAFDDLRRRRFAFTDPDSNTGCLVPTYMLARRGETPTGFFRDVYYTHSHDNSIRAVAEGQADGAAVDSLIWEFLNSVDPTLTSRTRVIARSEPYGIPPVVVHPRMDPRLKERLRALLLGLHRDPRAAPVLRTLQIDRFEAGTDSLYDSVREIRRWVEANPG